MKTVRLVRRLVKSPAPEVISYALEVEATYAENISKEIFVKQRIKKPDLSVDDVFVAVCSPTQLEDLDVGCPTEDTSYFRDSKFTVYGTNESFLDEIFTAVLVEVRLLIENAEALEVLEDEDTYEITAGSVEEV